MVVLPSSRGKRSPSSARLRVNLLNKLGIVAEGTMQRNRQPSRGFVVCKAQVLHEPLKGLEKKGLEGFPEHHSCSSETFFSALGTIFVSPATFIGTTKDSPSVASTSSASSCQSMSDDSSLSTSMSSATQRRISFNEDVSVVQIPTRREYSERIRKHLWVSPEEMQANVIRNSLEFAFDGYDARRVLEEDALIKDPSTGELIHPVHCEIARHLRRDRGLPEEGDITELLRTL